MKTISMITKNKDICLGVVSNTRHADIHDSLESLGMYWNLIPIHLNFMENHNLMDELDNVIRLVDSGYGRYPLPSILENAGKSDLFFATFKYLDFHHKVEDQQYLRLYKGINLYSYPLNFSIFKDKVNNAYMARIDYMPSYFSEEDIDKIFKQFLEECAK